MANIGKYLLAIILTGCSNEVQGLEKKCETVIQKIEQETVKSILMELPDVGNLCNSVDHHNLNVRMDIELKEDKVKINLTGYNRGEDYSSTARLEYTFCGTYFINDRWVYQCFYGGRKVVPQAILNLKKGETVRFDSVEFKAPPTKKEIYLLPHIDIVLSDKTLSIGDVVKKPLTK